MIDLLKKRASEFKLRARVRGNERQTLACALTFREGRKEAAPTAETALRCRSAQVFTSGQASDNVCKSVDKQSLVFYHGPKYQFRRD